jgi:prepilin-type N-terminal cleavage/methylation domain-containing protein
MRNRPAFTLLELALVLTILAIIAGTALPAFGRGVDAVSVGAARAELVSAFAVARVTAIRAGGASIIIDTATGRVWVETLAGQRVPNADYPVAARYGVALSTDRASSPVILRYDGLGIGRITSAVIRIQRRRASAAVTISAYGRVRTS